MGVPVAICFAITAAGSIAIGLAWLMLGRKISVVVDWCFPRPPSPRPTDPMLIAFDPAGISSHFTIGSWAWPLSWLSQPWPLEFKIVMDGHRRLVLHAGVRSFTFGPIQKRWNDPAKPEYQFAPETGDVVSFTRTTGRLPWPTPFAYNWLGGSVPKWKRFIYDRLRWTKDSGTVLEVVWRGEEWFYRRSGWADTCNNRLSSVRIHPGPIEKAVVAYLAWTKRWTSGEYRLETSPTASGDTIVTAVYLDDESATRPGAGKSIVLRVSKSSGSVTSEKAYQ